MAALLPSLRLPIILSATPPTTLFAALDVLSGNVIGERRDQHASADYIEFLKKIGKAREAGKVLRIVADNLATGKTKAARECLESIPRRFVPHFIPTHSSWLNLFERWFEKITNKRIRCGDFRSVPELVKAVRDYIETWNKSGRRFSWTKVPGEILAKVRKARSFL